MKTKLILLISIVFLIACSEKENGNNAGIVESEIQQEIQINMGDTLRIDLGNFGDEEGAWIFEAPQFAKISKIYRELSSSTMIYEYSPVDHFIGRDTVGLILNRGSDGASQGINDTTRICIITQ
ncbi:hypothetical protein EO244_09390 [Ancylomarina salipaludis]|uniref:Chagasin family peptidase inhibitor I42 n=1 Tax=Ancylomarina salipaludis TaxID=2501299 RepID=A0A4Q1JMG1_9BACT|nr:hypothetical protein [Ancylomarina salipaludis]RXQ94485.1 hypothetical protein EO244_09390 [Ancylomarina salipaludis]